MYSVLEIKHEQIVETLACDCCISSFYVLLIKRLYDKAVVSKFRT